MSRRLYAKISISLIFLMAAIGAVAVSGLFAAVEVITPPTYTTTNATHPELSAKAWQVFDMETGEVLYRDNADAVLPIASITKLFTAVQVLQRSDLFATTTITWGDIATEGRAGKLHYGESYSNHELLFPLLLESSNDAASALMRVHPSLLDEISLYAEDITLQHTVIRDPSGLSDENVSTASELAKVLRYIRRTQPELLDITRVPAYYAADNGWINNSPFINEDGYLGGKHGFTYAANRTAAVYFEETLLGGYDREIGYIVLGSDDLAADVTLLRDFVRAHTSYR